MDKMQTFIYNSLLLILSVCLSKLVHGSGIASVKFVNYIGDGKMADGKCCVPNILGMCGGRCDLFFTVCLNDPKITSSDSSPCSVGTFTTEITQDSNEIAFTDKIGSAPNPLKINFQSWATAIDLTVTVNHLSAGTNETKLVEELKKSVSITPTNTEQEIELSDRTSLFMSISVCCDEYYFGPGCGVYCKSSAGDNYECGKDGEKICKAGWTGADCETNLDECESSPCVHGSCEDLVNAYKCNCKKGFLGTNCDEEKDECDSSPCKNGGKCSDGANSFTCSCPKGFVGENCEVRNIPYACASNPCKGSATCKDVGASFECACPVERKGKLCETWIPHICDEKPCKNGGQCIRMGHAYRCVCHKGYYDIKCDREIGTGAKSSKLTGGAVANSGCLTLTLLSVPIFAIFK
uniref:Delta-like protein n=1 Tax=Platynereis dumerilii TaxID=6359 RepID=A0A1C6ZZW7_PLADU|nr:delta-like transmembrane protein 2 [Platynereis dumerilii]